MVALFRISVARRVIGTGSGMRLAPSRVAMVADPAAEGPVRSAADGWAVCPFRSVDAPARPATVGRMESVQRPSAERLALTRIAADPHVMLAIAVVLAALVIEVIAGADAIGLVGVSAIYLAGRCSSRSGPRPGVHPRSTRPACWSPLRSSSG